MLSSQLGQSLKSYRLFPDLGVGIALGHCHMLNFSGKANTSIHGLGEYNTAIDYLHIFFCKNPTSVQLVWCISLLFRDHYGNKSHHPVNISLLAQYNQLNSVSVFVHGKDLGRSSTPRGCTHVCLMGGACTQTPLEDAYICCFLGLLWEFIPVHNCPRKKG